MKNIFEKLKEKKFVEQLKNYNTMNKNYLETITNLQQTYDDEMAKKDKEIQELKNKINKFNEKYV